MSENGAHGGGDLDEAIAAIARTYEKVRENAEELTEALALARGEERRLLSALRQLEPEHPLVRKGPARSAGKGGASSKDSRDHHNFEPERLELVWGWIRARGGEAFSRTDLMAALEGQVSHYTISRVLHRFRAIEAVRLAGVAPPPDGRGKGPEVFKVLDVKTGDKEVAENAERYRATNPAGRKH